MKSISRFSLRLSDADRNSEDAFEERETIVYITKSKPNIKSNIESTKIPSSYENELIPDHG